MADQDANLARELGRVAEAINNLKGDRQEDRETARATAEQFKESVRELRNDIHGLTQTVQSWTNTVSAIAAQKLDERMATVESQMTLANRERDALKTRVSFYDKLLGGVWSIALKLIGIVGGSATVGALVAKFL